MPRLPRRRLVLAVPLVLATAVATPAAARTEPHPTTRSAVLATELRHALQAVRFQEVLDTDPVTSAGRTSRALVEVDKDARVASADPSGAQRIVQHPQVDATVIELDAHQRPVAAATVLMSPQYPNGVVVPLDRNLSTTAVRWRQWDDTGWYTDHGRGTVDVVPGREHAPLDFMTIYPASVLKTMATFGVLRLVDSGAIGLDDTYAYTPTVASSLCGGATTDTVRDYIDQAITESSNAAGCALIKLLWDHGAVGWLNQTFRDLGLSTLRLIDTNPANGGNWTNAVTMTSLDTAKLMAIVAGTPGTAWRTPSGRPVGHPLSEASRRFFLAELGQQGWNDQLTTSNWCGASYPAPGIPSRVAPRWLAPAGSSTVTDSVTVEGKSFQHDVRPCNARAQVTFAHKTGWVNNSANDAGIVTSLPGSRSRHYVVSVFTNLGTQYVDPRRPATAPGAPTVDFTQKLAQLGRRIDRLATAGR